MDPVAQTPVSTQVQEETTWILTLDQGMAASWKTTWAGAMIMAAVEKDYPPLFVEAGGFLSWPTCALQSMGPLSQTDNLLLM